MPKKKNNNIIFVLLSIIIIFSVIFTINIVRLVAKPTETTIVKKGELTKYEEVIGYIVRNETVVDTSEYEGIMQTEVDDLKRVSKGGTIATYVSKSEDSLMKKIAELDVKIEEAMETEKAIYSSDAKALDANIQILLYDNIKGNMNVLSIKDNKTKLNENIKKKAQIVGELSPVGSKLKQLINERNEYEREINNSKKELKSPIAGLVSYRLDSFENVLTPESISSLTAEKLNSFKLTTNQIIPRDNSKIKIIDNFETYIVMYMNSPESNEAKLNDKLYLRFEDSSNSLIPATVEYISEENDGRLIAVKIETNTENLSKYRKISLDVVWWSYEGFKLHKSLIQEKEVTDSNGRIIANLNYVTIKKSSYEEIAYVKIVKEFGDYAIVENYTDEEYMAMGFSESDIENFVTLKMYNEVMLNKK